VDRDLVDQRRDLDLGCVRNPALHSYGELEYLFVAALASHNHTSDGLVLQEVEGSPVSSSCLINSPTQKNNNTYEVMVHSAIQSGE
jgi:hypothetical protein